MTRGQAGEQSMLEHANDKERPSLHKRILDDIRGRILSGEWPPGHRIPFEYELTQQYACSRMTVNKALSQLVKTGFIERRRRSGSYVRRPQLQSAVLEIHDIETEVRALGLPYRYELMARRERRSTPTDRRRLDVAASTRVLQLVCRHFAGDMPFCLEDRLIALSAVPEAAGEEFIEVAPGPWLLSRVPWSAAEHMIRASDADAAIASGLQTIEGTVCLIIERRTWMNEQPITQVRLAYTGDSHVLVARFSPQD